MRSFRLSMLVAAAITLLITLVSAGVPFMWDTVYHTMVAGHFLVNGFGTGLPPAAISNGNPTLYPALLALAWTVIGQSLLVSHIFFAFILFFTLAGFIRLAGLFLTGMQILLAMVIFCLDPGFMAQGMLMGYDVLLLGLTLWAGWAAIRGKWGWLALFSILLVLTHFRGLFALGVPVMALFLIRDRSSLRSARMMLAFLPALLCFSGWMILHKSGNGFLILSDSNAAYLGDVGFTQWLRNMAYAVWKLLDLGRAALWISVTVMALAYRKKLDDSDRALFILALTPLVLYLIAFSGSMLPVSHRYFMASQALIILAFTRLLRFLPSPRQWILAAMTGIVLLSGNFWFYPQRFGNAWDSSLIFINWPQTEREIRDHLLREGIEPQDVMAEYPLTYCHADMYLDGDSTRFIPYHPSAPGPGDRLLLTNFSNMYDPDEFGPGSGWVPEWTTDHGRIHAVLLRFDPGQER